MRINGVLLPGALSAEAFAGGVNLTTLASARPTSPSEVNAIAAQGRAILAAVAAKEGLVGQWRGLSQRAHAVGAAAELKDQLAELTKSVVAADEKIREAAKPASLHFEIGPHQ